MRESLSDSTADDSVLIRRYAIALGVVSCRAPGSVTSAFDINAFRSVCLR